jgi:hypothetical protein
MALSISELASQATELLPAREVMSSSGGHFSDHDTATYGPACNEYYGGLLNGINIQDVASDIGIDEVQVGLVNVIVEDIHDVADVATANTEL